MKIKLITLLFLLVSFMASSQNSTGINTINPSSKAALDVHTDGTLKQGILVPRLSATDTTILKSGIPAHSKGLLFYDTLNTVYRFWTGSKWLAFGNGQAMDGAGFTNKLAFWDSPSSLSYNVNLHWNNTNENFGIGTATPSNTLHVASDGLTGTSSVIFEGHSTLATRGPGISITRSKGTIAAPAAVSNGDYLGGITVSGRTASANNLSSFIHFYVDGPVAGTSVPGAIRFNTTTAGASSPSEKMRITNDGNVGIGTTIMTDVLNVKGGPLTGISLLGATSQTLRIYFDAGSILKFEASNPIEFHPNGAGLAMHIDDGDIITYVPTSIRSNFALGANGSVLTDIIKITANIDVVNMAANSGATQNVAVPGVQVGSSVVVSPAGSFGALIAWARVSGANNVQILFFNPTGAAFNPVAMDFYITVIR